jgi:hypothetical protein
MTEATAVGAGERVLSQAQLALVLSGLEPDDCGANRRNKDRRGFSCPMSLIPVASDGELLRSKAMRVTGKDLSETGIGFVHALPLFHKNAIVAFDHPKIGTFAVEVQILWTTNIAMGFYESGCRMVRKTAEHALRAQSN